MPNAVTEPLIPTAQESATGGIEPWRWVRSTASLIEHNVMRHESTKAFAHARPRLTVGLAAGIVLAALAVVLVPSTVIPAKDCAFPSYLNDPECVRHPVVTSATMTKTASQWPTPSQWPTSSATASQTASQLETASQTASQLETASVTASQSISLSQSVSQAASSMTRTGTQTSSPTASQTDTQSATVTASQSVTSSGSPSFTPTTTTSPTPTMSRFTQMFLNNCVLALEVTRQSITACVNGAIWQGGMGGANSSMRVQINQGQATGYLESPWGNGVSVDLPVTDSDAEMQANMALVTVGASTRAVSISMIGSGDHVTYTGGVPFVGQALAEQVNAQLSLPSGAGVYAATFADQFVAAEHANLRGVAPVEELSVLD